MPVLGMLPVRQVSKEQVLLVPEVPTMPVPGELQKPSARLLPMALMAAEPAHRSGGPPVPASRAGRGPAQSLDRWPHPAPRQDRRCGRA